jgi:hypothetical protein
MKGEAMFRKGIIYSFFIASWVVVLAGHVLAEGHFGITDCFICHDFHHPGDYDCTSCHDFEEGFFPGESHYNLRWIPDSIEYPPGNIHQPVKFTAFSWNPAWGPTPDGTLADGDDTQLDGPCEVCHTKTVYHTNSGDETTHFDGVDCLPCHPHFPSGEDYFAPQLKGPQSHETHLHTKKGPKIRECTECHYPTDYSRFADDKSLVSTTVCDACHSPDGVYDGVADKTVGAKRNWENGVYKPGGKKLKKNKGLWCATCHDDGTSVVKGASAPNVMGDNSSYGYNVSGHGRPGVDVACAGCHNLTKKHTDGRQRTYAADSTSYRKSYRLLYGLDIPRETSSGPEAFKLCFACHQYDDIFGPATCFRDDEKQQNYHDLHLDTFGFFECWDSDWDGTVDSAMSCTACHNIHGSPMKKRGTYIPNPVMLRHGELISTAGTEDKVPALDFRWYNDKGKKTGLRKKSRCVGLVCGAVPDLAENHVCYGCHPTGLITYCRTCETP